jgi:natural product biosynthesis luciferase-like monooxygenase protein
MRFSLSYFSAGTGAPVQRSYELLFSGAKFADLNGFHAVWIPERHFQQFGDISPNPSVLGAGLAVITNAVRIRAGSVVAPLHHPLRIAEEWSVVDNLSNGRIDLSFASGWHPADFILSAAPYDERRKVMLEQIHCIRSLWENGVGHFRGVDGVQREVRFHPRPVQRRLPIWITTSGNPATWELAGKLGANVLASLIGESVSSVKKKIQIYRGALREHQHDSSQGQVTIMLHTFVGEDEASVREVVSPPLRNYIRTYLSQKEDPNVLTKSTGGLNIIAMSEREKSDLANIALERYLKGGALLGTVESCTKTIDSLMAIGVDEVACLVDFGVDHQLINNNLVNLRRLKDRYAGSIAS